MMWRSKKDDELIARLQRQLEEESQLFLECRVRERQLRAQMEVANQLVRDIANELDKPNYFYLDFGINLNRYKMAHDPKFGDELRSKVKEVMVKMRDQKFELQSIKLNCSPPPTIEERVEALEKKLAQKSRK